MSDNKCSFCPRTFATRNGLSKHMLTCVKTAETNVQIESKSLNKVRNYPKPVYKNKTKQVDLNEYYSNRDFSTKMISFKDIKFRKDLKLSKPFELSSNNYLDSTYAGPSGVSNTDELSVDLANMSFELDESNNFANYFELNTSSFFPDELKSTLHINQKFLMIF